MTNTSYQDHVVEGALVLVLTRGYHFVGRIVLVTALRLVLVDATMFVDVGQIDLAVKGEWDGNAHGRQVGDADLYRPSCDILRFRGALPKAPIGN
jgi:hypothetical protein